MRRFVSYGPSLVVLITAALTLIAGPVAIRQMQSARTAATITLAQQRLDEDNLLERINQSVRDIAATVEPSVVYIRAQMPRRRGVSTGSGWLYDNKGHIVTNAHVITGADDISINLHDGRVREAKFIGMDASTDIAVVQIEADATTLFPARRASGQPLFQGDAVFAFGSPFGFKFSMSKGIVSGLGRDAQTGAGAAATQYSNFIQTDAAINPGNSGGPLVDVNGRVVGMNTAIITGDSDEADDSRPRAPRREVGTGSLGIGFAIPLETIESVVDQLIERGVVLKGFLGVSLSDLNAAAAEQTGFNEGSGVLITSVMPNMPAANAGLERFDIITRVDDRPTPSLAVLRSLISNRRPDATVKLTVWRDGKTVEREVTLAAALMNANNEPVPVDHERLLAEVEKNQRFAQVARSLAAFGLGALSDGEKGIVIEDVSQASTAQAVGFRPGEQIVRAMDKSVRTKEDLYEALRPLLLATGVSEAPVTVVDSAGNERQARLLIAP